ncbi:MAG: hypothetical protein FJ399_14995, partial [Verrucomicrobia bacterium]|nr:hypothetical protein [Verrucomicrobiota bacterium]
MKTPFQRRIRRSLINSAAVAFLAIAPRMHACEACAPAMTIRLLGGENPSAHAAELVSLVKNSSWEGSQRLLTNVFASGAVTSPAALAAAGLRAPPLALTATPAAAPASGGPAAKTAAAAHPFQSIIDRDKKLGIWETGYVAPGTTPDKKFTLVMSEGDVFLGNGVVYSGFTVNGTIPGPTIIAEEGDVVEFTIVNKGDVAHGVSIHAAYTQTSKYLGRINPGQTKAHVFRVNHPGVYMYHCAPGGHAIPMHTLLGQYGIFVVKPKTRKFKMEEVMGR